MNNGNKFRDRKHYVRPKQKGFILKKNFYSKITTKFIGLGLLFLIIFIYLSFIAYVFTFQKDQVLVEECLKNIFTSHQVKVHNWFGVNGAIISYLFVYKFLGFIPASLFLFPFFIWSCAMIGCKYFQRWDMIKTFALSFLSMFFANACIGLFLNQEFYSPFAGFLSYYVAEVLKKVFGSIAYPLVLILIFILLFLKFKRTLRRRFYKKNHEDDERNNTITEKSQSNDI